MGKAHEVAIGADGRAFDQGIRSGVIKPTEDAVKALGKLEDAASDTGRDGSRDLNRLEESLKDVQQQSAKTERAMDDIGDSGKRGFAKAGDSMDEFKSEANSTAKESAASFDGSADSIKDAFQEVAANAFSGFGPVGAAAGLAAAAGIGLAAAGFEATDEANEASQERIASWASKYIESGDRIISAAQVISEVLAIAEDPERSKEAAKNAEDWGVVEQTAMRAMAGDATALEVVRRTLNDRTEESARLLKEQEKQVDSNAGAAYDLADSVQRGADSFAKLTGEMTEGERNFQTTSAALKDIIRDAGEAGVEVDEFGNQLFTLPGDVKVMVDAKTGLASENVSRFKGDVDGIIDTVTTTAVFDDTDARRKYEAWRATVTQRLAVPVTMNTVGPVKWD